MFHFHRRVWFLAILFGLGTAAYACVLAWLAPFYLDLGFSSRETGMLLVFLTVLEVVAGLTIPNLAVKKIDRRPHLKPHHNPSLRPSPLLLSLCIGAGFAGLVFFPLTLLSVWPVMLGIGIGGLFHRRFISR